MRYIRVFSELSNQIRFATQKRIMVEMAIIKLCKPQMEQDYSSIIDRLDSLEKKMENGVPVVAASSGGAVQNPQATPIVKQELPKAIPEDIENVMKSWKSILSEIGGTSRVFLNKAVTTLGPAGELVLVFDDENAYEFINQNKAECVDSLIAKIGERIGKEINVVIKKNETGRTAKETVPDLRDLIQFEIEEENF